MLKPCLSVVVPVYNEEAVIPEFYARLTAVLKKMDLTYEILFVNDGSADASPALLESLKRRDTAVRTLHFSRNFGHQLAVKAGIDHAAGEAVVIIDADLQDPPEEIDALVKKWREGYDVVYAVRAQRDGETFFKKWTASVYYALVRRIASVSIPPDAGDFRLISEEVADVIRGIQEQNPYLRGLISWVGFRQIGVFIHRQPRFSGKTKYSLKKMLGLAWSGITHFSFFPLHLAGISGVVCLLAAVGIWIVGGIGSPTLLLAGLLFFLTGIQLLSVGILGLYLARNYDQSRARPLYILKKNRAEDAKSHGPEEVI